MTNIDTEQMYNNEILPTPEHHDFEVDDAMEDHDMLLQHVTQHDHELYALDCCLGEIMSV